MRLTFLLIPSVLTVGALAAAVSIPRARTELQSHPAVHASPAAAPAPVLPGRIRLTPQQAREAYATGQFARPIATLIDVREPLRFGQYRWNDQGVAANPVWISVDLQRQLISVFRGPDEIGTAVILFGADTRETPIGTFPILAKLKHHTSITYDNAPMPYTLRLTADGVSIHGSNVRDGYATHGCIGVPVEFAAKLFGAVSQGDKVIISDPLPPRRA